MVALAQLIDVVIQIYIWILIASAVLSWLLAFGIVNRYNPVVNRVGQFCNALTEPVLRPIRRVIPLIAGRELLGVLDLDSPSVGRFNEGDGRGLERLAAVFLDNVRLEDIG